MGPLLPDTQLKGEDLAGKGMFLAGKGMYLRSRYLDASGQAVPAVWLVPADLSENT